MLRCMRKLVSFTNGNSHGLSIGTEICSLFNAINWNSNISASSFHKRSDVSATIRSNSWHYLAMSQSVLKAGLYTYL